MGIVSNIECIFYITQMYEIYVVWMTLSVSSLFVLSLSICSHRRGIAVGLVAAGLRLRAGSDVTMCCFVLSFGL